MRVAIIADTHCGHRTGLTPTEYQYQFKDGFLGKLAQLQKEMWDWYCKEMASYQPIDLLIVNGDALDGKGAKSGSTELITADPAEQIKMAEIVINQCRSKQILIINGTPYHTGTETDYEGILAEKIGADYANHDFVKCGGLVFDVKHKTSSSQIPHGRFTGPARDALWNIIQASKGLQPNADVIVRSHVHYKSLSESYGKTVITTPCLQAMSKFGSRECAGTNDLGFLHFDCEDKKMSITEHIFDMKPFSHEVRNYDK
jgi:hypothetical protein